MGRPRSYRGLALLFVVALGGGGTARAQPPDTAATDASDAGSDATGDASPAPSADTEAAPAPSADTEAPADTEADASAESPPEPEPPPSGPSVSATFGGYVEANYTYSFAQPSNGVVALRGFDNQHNTITLANVALFMRLDYDRVYANVGVQWGNTPTTYYLAEPGRGAIGGTGPSDASTWRWLQVAYLGWSIPVEGMTLLVEGGLFLSPIGIEAMQVSQNWNFSRSNLFFGCPFYHSGVRAQLDVNDEWSISAAVWNGWNTLLDNNDEKSFSVAADFTGESFSAHLLYFSGVERNPGYAGGRAWRHLFDAWARGDVTSWLSLAIHGDAGFEPSTIGTASWEAIAGYVHVVPIEWMAISLRGDFFREEGPTDAMGNRSPIFWPVEWVSGSTATISFTPIAALTFFLEYRHDQAAGSAFYAGSVPLDLAMMPTIANADHQDTITVGASGNISGLHVGD